MKHTPQDIFAKIRTKFPQFAVEEINPGNGDVALLVQPHMLPEVVHYLKESSELSFDFLMNLSAFDGLKWVEGGAGDFIEVTYHLYSYTHRHTVILKVRPSRQGGAVPTLTSLYGTADFQEREVFDHFGVVFSGHPNLKRILLPDDWIGHPLLKDYKEQEDYNGIGTTRPSML